MGTRIRQYVALVAAAVTGVAALGGIAGCGSSTSGGESSATPSVSAAPVHPSDLAEKQALDAYRGMWRAYAGAALTANPDDHTLATYASGGALETLKAGLADLRRKGEVIKGEYVSDPRVAGASPAVEPTAIVIEDCLDDSRFLTYKASGELAGGEAGGRRATRANVTLVAAGQWKVSEFGIQAVGTC